MIKPIISDLRIVVQEDNPLALTDTEPDVTVQSKIPVGRVANHADISNLSGQTVQQRRCPRVATIVNTDHLEPDRRSRREQRTDALLGQIRLVKYRDNHGYQIRLSRPFGPFIPG